MAFDLYAESNLAAVLYSKDGKGDHAFNDAAWEGVKLAKKDLGVNVLEIEPRNFADASAKVSSVAKTSVSLIIAVGFPYADLIKELAPKFPKTHFAVVDGTLEAPNVAIWLC